MKKPKRQTIEELRIEYKTVTGQDPAIRWNRSTLQKKITDAEILQAGYAEKERSSNRPVAVDDVKPEFEALANDNEPQSSSVPDVQVDGRGGPREGAGRPVGQSDERARIERLLALEKPDLCVRKIVQGLNLVMAKFTELPFTAEQVESISLGVTLPLYFWFPKTEGAANKLTLHLQALEYIGEPFVARAKSINELHNQKAKDEENDKENKTAGPATAGPATAGPETAGPDIGDSDRPAPRKPEKPRKIAYRSGRDKKRRR